MRRHESSHRRDVHERVHQTENRDKIMKDMEPPNASHLQAEDGDDHKPPSRSDMSVSMRDLLNDFRQKVSRPSTSRRRASWR